MDDVGTILIDGSSYPLPGDDLTLGEMRILKRVSGTMPDLSNEKTFMDPDVLIGLAIIAKARSGESITEEQAEAIPLGAFGAGGKAEVGDDVDPPVVPANASPVSGGAEATYSPSSATIHAAGGARS